MDKAEFEKVNKGNFYQQEITLSPFPSRMLQIDDNKWIDPTIVKVVQYRRPGIDLDEKFLIKTESPYFVFYFSLKDPCEYYYSTDNKYFDGIKKYFNIETT